ncbi:vascular cell adhesion protein 1-like [Acipenser oxyrinchus oxyrinchus]|uniref:Vascular cell adhesion protein 1-like n=1 Tax=Acipenser oxyrinchus oxyrinchus TaxID=40147 RepID=A0AAD8G5Q7_ACIOX|nr:vascular cell adhesion protein 1-like [Acipenser oxyrinchus oxyrinchus]
MGFNSQFIGVLLFVFLNRVLSFKAEIDPPHRRITVENGSDLVLICRAKDCLSPTFSWIALEDKPMYMKLENDVLESRAVLTPVSRDNDNTYICKVSCGSQRAQKSIEIKVYSFPSDPVIESHAPLQEGKEAALTCKVPDVYPQEYLEIQWLDGERVLKESDNQESSSLSLTYKFVPKIEETGKKLTCKAVLAMEGIPEAQKTKTTTTTFDVQCAPQKPLVSGSPSSTLREGEEMSLTCSTQSNPPAELVWKKLLPQGQSQVVAEGGTLFIGKAQPFDSGEYQCEALNALGRSSTNIEITVQVAPKNTSISVYPAEALKEGDSMTVSCASHSNPAATITLRKKSPTGDRELESSNGSLTINEAQLGDAGLYECEATNEFGSEKATVNISVEAIPFEVEMDPPQRELTVESGSDLVLICRVAHCPSPQFTWKHPTDRPQYDKTDTEGNESRISLSSVGTNQENIYRCQVKCGSVIKESSTQIKVYSFPSDPVIESHAPLQEGKEAALTCKVASVYPQEYLEIQWLDGERVLKRDEGIYVKNNDVSNLTSTYTFVPKMEDSGKEVTCKAVFKMEGIPDQKKSKASAVSLNIHVSPKNTSISVYPAEALKEGDSMTVSCASHSNPAATITLRKKSPTGDRELESSNGSLTINEAQLGDSGLYECEATNEFGSEKASVEISVKVPPRNTTVLVYPSTEVLEGQNITISCKTVSYPAPTIVLKKIGNGTTFCSNNGTFELYYLTTNDTGLYELNVTNDVGHEVEVIEIHVGKRLEGKMSPPYLAILIPIIGASAAVLAAALFVIRLLRQAQSRGSYALTQLNPAAV